MDQRNSRRQIAEQTLQELRQGYYVSPKGQSISIKDHVQHSIDESRLYSMAELELLLSNRKSHSNSCVTTATNTSTIECLSSVYSENKRIALLNFASAKNPGGGFLGGSQAQEESLARSSSLYPALLQNSKYYETNKRSANAFYTDNLIYSPQVVFFKNDQGDYLEQYYKADVVTMPAVNRGALEFVNEQVQQEIDNTMKRRIRYVLAVSEKNSVDILILGAWGCGVFKNQPEKIAANFSEVMNEKPTFDIPQIIFAVLDRDGKTFGAFAGLASV